ncbi:UTP--glucose-1-phosphate uridylyltransferase GalU [Clostridium tyrobutyricum]|jgi:UTP--glucose-1-phosphate uridylyltransferase|uniref:UTP--glucose-1-phosphate uridylyltransferase n=1 Tax=Clostridium tyrobutyricum DIVETGP TaxID=1408889 RepID=W6N604_CLOTY|nr:UTP--glucose-1-phosphate uridylyltransferase GalU [Clostridium tyrobutyricum]AND85462.1 UTP--glucose-1-phosphate uridylyltransferase [Clostridium tyrobutyricum]ANP70008.1 UTP--glucose-1-phosphate uridylyltransferase [Clostridium tyrobutyricum]MBV4428825.1 UTP--glucose-1-phosphate uridylyltransferase GalU [Clostridium tyrobutyricum]MBV4434063.1 UTP--glucose-1-phosphate uridylyltransferase GalU [Clostridium tyrobutyricum]MBV4444033.1 UTP--glucose-1-phosphate uridylyltransferase GalU [Clostrid
MSIKKAIIPAAGLGTRFLPATKSQPKEMLPIVDKPTIQYIVEEAVASGIEEILIITGRNKRSIEDHFDKSMELENELKNKGKNDLLKIVRDISNMADIYYIRQKEPKGLGHAIGLAKSFIDKSPFAVMLGDDIVDSTTPCLKQLMKCHDKYNSSILGVQHVEKDAVSKYGIISGSKIEDRVYKIEDLIEKPSIEKAPSNIAILGRYIITPEIFNIIENTKPDKSGEIQLTDALRELSKHEEIHAYSFEGQRFDAGDKFGFLQANIHYALKKDKLRNKLIKYMENIMPQNCLK